MFYDTGTDGTGTGISYCDMMFLIRPVDTDVGGKTGEIRGIRDIFLLISLCGSNIIPPILLTGNTQTGERRKPYSGDLIRVVILSIRWCSPGHRCRSKIFNQTSSVQVKVIRSGAMRVPGYHLTNSSGFSPSDSDDMIFSISGRKNSSNTDSELLSELL